MRRVLACDILYPDVLQDRRAVIDGARAAVTCMLCPIARIAGIEAVDDYRCVNVLHSDIVYKYVVDDTGGSAPTARLEP